MHKVLLQDDLTAGDIWIHDKLIYNLQGGGAFTRALCEVCAWCRGGGGQELLLVCVGVRL